MQIHAGLLLACRAGIIVLAGEEISCRWAQRLERFPPWPFIRFSGLHVSPFGEVVGVMNLLSSGMLYMFGSMRDRMPDLVLGN